MMLNRFFFMSSRRASSFASNALRDVATMDSRAGSRNVCVRTSTSRSRALRSFKDTTVGGTKSAGFHGNSLRWRSWFRTISAQLDSFTCASARLARSNAVLAAWRAIVERFVSVMCL